MIHSEFVIDKVVYDMDQVVIQAGSNSSRLTANLSNRDEVRCDKPSVITSNFTYFKCFIYSVVVIVQLFTLYFITLWIFNFDIYMFAFKLPFVW